MTRTLTILLMASCMFSASCSRNATASAAAQNSSDQSTSTIAEDHDKLQGTWKLDRATFNGQAITKDIRWVFDGDHMTIMSNGKETLRSEFQLGTGQSPNTIRIKYLNNGLENLGVTGGSYTGIYNLSGDKLRVCYDLTGLQYPRDFDAPKGANRISEEFTREKI
jgi:uncharacterized protein (TIGR03067 family)